ncbi:outer membrane beta-barrel protein [Dyadobacter sp. CY356]|nr:outer membrane beta-barrel protein [Dyadobacter sp. CY356]
MITSLVFLLGNIAASQNTSINGFVKDTIDFSDLSGSKVKLVRSIDDTLMAESELNSAGFFNFKNIPTGNYQINIDVLGYRHISKNVKSSAENTILSSGTIYLVKYVILLDTVIIKNTPEPITFKKDTIEYHAESFLAQHNASVEDLLRKLPGLIITAEGKILANGKEISQILVDNEPFFNGDIKLTTRTLPAEIIDKIQLYNSNSELSNLIGIDDGQRIKTINLKIKKNRKKGIFGQAATSVGTNNLFGFGGSLNNFNNKKQLSLVSQITNANDPLFSSFITTGSINTGINKSSGLGGNFKNNFGKNWKADGTYIETNQTNKSIQDIVAKNIYTPDSTTIQTLKNSSNRDSKSQRINLNISGKFSNRNNLVIRSNFNKNRLFNNQLQNSILKLNNRDTIYHSNNTNNVSSKSFELGSNLLFTHSFKTYKRSLVYTTDFRCTDSKSIDSNFSKNYYVSPNKKESTLNQKRNSNPNSSFLTSGISFFEPVAKDQMVQISYNFRIVKKSIFTKVFSLDTLERPSDIDDSLQSNKTKSNLINQELLLKYQIQKSNFSLFVANTLNFQTFKVYDLITNSLTTRKYKTFTPSINLEYNLTAGKFLQFGYNISNQQPDISQLQNLTTTNDSLYIQKGNPSLKQMWIHNVLLGYRINFQSNQSVINFDLNGTLIHNDIQYSTSILKDGTQVTQPINVNGSYLVTGSLDYSLPFKKSSFQINSSINYTQNRAMLNDRMVNTNNYNLRGKIGVNSTINQSFSMTLTYNTTLGYATYVSEKKIKTNFFLQNLLANIKYFPAPSYFLSLKSDINHNSGLAQQKALLLPILSISAGKYLFTNKKMEMKITISDLLNKNKVASTSVNQNSIQSMQINSRGRYLLLSLIYNFRKF